MRVNYGKELTTKENENDSPTKNTSSSALRQIYDGKIRTVHNSKFFLLGNDIIIESLI